MKYYFAPMEGITTYLFLNVHAAHFPGIDRYYAPFISANHNYSFQNKELRDIAPENNTAQPLIPQILTKNAEEFVWGARFLEKMGFDEVNLNLGCPSSTVTAKGKGAGMLADPEELRRFLEEVFNGLANDGIRVSVKTRLGWKQPEEGKKLISIYNEYPISELTVHARVGTAMYRGKADRVGFSAMYEEAKMPVVYNGDINSAEDLAKIEECFPELSAVMIGRGLIRNPALVRECKGGKLLTKKERKSFHDDFFNACLEHYTERIAVGKMKELWYFWGDLYPDAKRSVFTIRKAKNRMEYIAAANAVL